MTSGSLFANGGLAWTGNPDSCSKASLIGTPSCTNSNVFRLNSKSAYSGNLKISLDLYQNKDFHGDPDAWHGVHIWLRYQSQYNLYYASINRADGNVVIKRKVPCGSDIACLISKQVLQFRLL